MNPRDRAVRLLTIYLRTIYRSAGLSWTSDNDAEIADLTDDLISASQSTRIYTKAEAAEIDRRLVQVTQPQE